VQVLDGPPDVFIRRPSTFLLIPAGSAGRDLRLAMWIASGRAALGA